MRIVSIILFLAIFGIFSNPLFCDLCVAEMEKPYQEYNRNKQEPAYIAHPPIRIDSNADFDSSHGVTSGSGTVSDPWIIENYNISGEGFGYCVYIGNTSNHFILRDCLLENAKWGVIYDPYITDSGLTLCYVSNGKIENNTIKTCINDGIYAKSSQDTILVGNHILSNNNYGINLDASAYLTIDRNNISDNKMNGIQMYRCQFNAIRNNSIFSNGENGIYMTYYGTNTMNDNLIGGNVKNGIHTYKSNGNTMRSNTLFFQTENGILSQQSTSNTVDGNYLRDNLCGIAVDSSGGNVITYNTAILNKDFGILFTSSGNAIVTGNTVSGSKNGLSFEISGGSKILGNNATGNDNGIYMYGSDNCILDQNNIYYNGDGINIDESDNNQISNNTVRSNTENGFSIINAAENNIFNNTARSNKQYGFFIWYYARNNTLTGNNISYNGLHGINITTGCSGNIVTSNTFVGNNLGGRQAYDDTGLNLWNTTFGGNRWSDWASPDNNSDGFVDLAYYIEGMKGSADFMPIAWVPPPVDENTSTFPAIILTVLLFCVLTTHRRKKQV